MRHFRLIILLLALDQGRITLLDVGTHDDVYRK
jgi:hypothetical protein